MSKTKNISEKYRCYIIRIKQDGKYFYCLWGPNNRNMDDQLLIHRNNSIIKFRSIREIKDNSDNISKFNFRTRRFRKWKEELLKSRVISSTTLNFDEINNTFNRKFNPLKINSRYLRDYIDYINLFDDYAIQLNDKRLFKLSSKNQIRLLWLFTYDYYFWGVKGKEKEKTIKLITTKWDQNKFTEEFSKLSVCFSGSFTWL